MRQEAIVTTSELAREVFVLVEAKTLGKASPAEFEMAYQIRVATDRIRFAIKQIEQFSGNCSSVHETGLQLVDALDRLQAAEQHFQQRFHSARNLNAATSSLQTPNGDFEQ